MDKPKRKGPDAFTVLLVVVFCLLVVPVIVGMATGSTRIGGCSSWIVLALIIAWYKIKPF